MCEWFASLILRPQFHHSFCNSGCKPLAAHVLICKYNIVACLLILISSTDLDNRKWTTGSKDHSCTIKQVKQNMQLCVIYIIMHIMYVYAYIIKARAKYQALGPISVAISVLPCNKRFITWPTMYPLYQNIRNHKLYLATPVSAFCCESKLSF